MASYTYPVARPTGTLTAAQVHLLLSRPNLIAKRVASLLDQKFLMDYLLQGRFVAQGGGIFYETGEEIFAADSPQAVEAGGEYPLTVLTSGDIAAAKTVKWGNDTLITDEKIAREGLQFVDRALRRLANNVVRYVDGVGWGVIASKVTDTFASPANWTSTKNIITAVLGARGAKEALGLGLSLDTVVLNGDDFATVMGLFLSDGLLPRENQNMILSGALPASVLGFDWVTGSGVSGSNPWMFDREQLGGMADEKLGGPGYAELDGLGVEVKSIRDDDNDQYKERARRVTVPIVTEPHAGAAITGTGL